MGDMDDIDLLLCRRPWVNGSFIAPSMADFVRAYYVTQGARGEELDKFTNAHLLELKTFMMKLKGE